MAIAYFDCFSGISGDMALGALLDSGVPIEELRAGLASLPVGGWQIASQPVLQSGIHGLDVTISLNGKTDAQELQQLLAHRAAPQHAHAHAAPDEHDHDHHHEHGHHHGHEHHLHADHHHDHDDHHHEHHHHHEHYHHESHAHHHSHGRSMAEIRELIEASALSATVKQRSLAIFERIAGAEAYLHHSTIEDVHFHEIGGIDSLIDICGVAWCLEYLGVDKVYCSALPYSTGFVECAHGRMPVPAPATMELLKDVPLVPSDIKGELVTPTGAGIVTALASGYGTPPALVPRRIGFGSGKKRFADRPNLLRVVIGEPFTSDAQEPAVSPAPTGAAGAAIEGLEQQLLSTVETNIDDMNPELYGTVIERLFAVGALDVWLQPLQMKKNRPGVLCGVLCDEVNKPAVIATLLRETTTLGVRVTQTLRYSLARSSEAVETPYGLIRVKIATWREGRLWRAAPEYADVESAATSHAVPAWQVYQMALTGAQRLRPDWATGD